MPESGRHLLPQVSQLKRRFARAGIGLLLAFGASIAHAEPSPTPSEVPWVKVFDRNGITVFRRPVVGSKFYELRATGKIAARFARLVAVLRDMPNKSKWMKMLKEARVVGPPGAEQTEYYHFKTPFIIADRDLLVRTTFTIDLQARQVVFTAKSTLDPSVPERPGIVRANVSSARMVLAPADGGNSTLVESEVHSEPRGSIPAWAYNFMQKTAPKQSLDELKQRLDAANIVDYPGLDFAASTKVDDARK